MPKTIGICSICHKHRLLVENKNTCDSCRYVQDMNALCSKCKRQGECQDFPNRAFPPPIQIINEGYESSTSYCSSCMDYGNVGFIHPNGRLGKLLSNTFLKSWVIHTCPRCNGKPVSRCPNYGK